jgi:very-short-patch-repair endonuclease
VTSVPRTLLDLSAQTPSSLRRLVKQAEFMRLVDATALAAVLEWFPTRAGRQRLAAILDGGLLGAGRTRSELEDRFLAFCRRQRLPMPETNVVLDVGRQRLEVDCVWRDARVVVELDGHQAHGGRLAFERDRDRDRALIAAGWVPLRVTWAQLERDAVAVASELRETLARRRSGR